MANRKQRPPSQPLGPEDVPVDAPDNSAPAISPHAVSRMHRAEDDEAARIESPEFSDRQSIAHDDRRSQERWIPGSPGSEHRTDSSRGLDSAGTRNREPNPSHEPSHAAAPPGRGQGELRDQPRSTGEARQPGADDPRFDE
jgi:hypothetical protein